MYAPPTTEGNLKIEIDKSSDIVIEDKEFFVAITLQSVETSGVDVPLCVGKVT